MNDTPLNYATTAHTEAVTWTGRELQIDLGPMPGWTFFAVLSPRAIWLGISVGILGLMAVNGSTVLFFWCFFGLSTLLTSLSLKRSWRYRGCPRMVWASHMRLGYSDPRTRGRPRHARGWKHHAVRININPIRPWVFELVADPVISQYSVTLAKSLTLLIHSDRRQLAGLVDVIEMARTPLRMTATSAGRSRFCRSNPKRMRGGARE